jgi:hypothetical protein
MCAEEEQKEEGLIAITMEIEAEERWRLMAIQEAMEDEWRLQINIMIEAGETTFRKKVKVNQDLTLIIAAILDIPVTRGLPGTEGTTSLPSEILEAPLATTIAVLVEVVVLARVDSLAVVAVMRVAVAPPVEEVAVEAVTKGLTSKLSV